MNFIKKKELTAFIVIIFLFFYFFIFNNIVLAQEILPTETGASGSMDCRGAPEGTTNCGDYGINDFIQLGINAANWILGIVGSLALLMFVYGGVMMIISSGKSEQTEKAKSILKNTIIGIVIVFTAWTIISFTYKAFQAANQTWYQAP